MAKTGSTGLSLWRLISVLILSFLITLMGLYRLNPTMQSLFASLNDAQQYNDNLIGMVDQQQQQRTGSSSVGIEQRRIDSEKGQVPSDGNNNNPSTASVADRGTTNSTVSNSTEEVSSSGRSAGGDTKRHDAQQRNDQQQKDINNDASAADTTAKPKETSAPKAPLNIVLFYADDWTYKTLGAMGNTYVKTPILDQLAQDGVLFTHNCVTTSICMQSRATLYTGQYVSQHQTLFSWRNVTMYEPNRWHNTLYPTMLRNGYHVGFVGKYHHLEPPPGPTFSYFVSAEMNHFPNRGDGTKHITEWNEHDAKDFLTTRPKDQPFFLTVSFFATHAEDGNVEGYRPQQSSQHLYENEPVPLPKTFTEQHWKDLPHFFHEENFGRGRFRGRYDTPEIHQTMMKRMYRMATEVDTACGNIMQVLKEQGVYDTTAIIFTTDNGNFHGEHGLAEKWYPYEESLRVPLIIKDPRMPKTMMGTHNEEFTLNIDLAPTILRMANIDVPHVMQGRDLAPLYLEKEVAIQSWRKEFFYEFTYDIPYYIPHSVALVGKGFKYIYWTDHDYPQYFDLNTDPYEEYDIHNTSDATVLLELKRRMMELKASVANGVSQ